MPLQAASKPPHSCSDPHVVLLTPFHHNSACITSILRTYYTWKIVQSSDVSYHMVQMGMWTYAELSTGVVISCLPVIPRFFQHVGPKLSSALSLRYKSTKDCGSTSAAKPVESVRANEKIKLPNFKHTFASVVTGEEKDEDVEIQGRKELPVGEYVRIDEETGMPRGHVTRELSQMEGGKFATVRDDLERAYGRF